jgi:hypothetical protein
MALVAGLALPVTGQTVGSESGQAAGCNVAPNATKVSLNQATPVKHQIQPYTAELKIINVQTLGNGTTITSESTRVQARDSQDRWMNSTTMIQQYGDGTPMTRVSVQDPIAGTQTSWFSQTRKATVVKLPPVEQRHGCWQSVSGHFRTQYSPARPSGTLPQSAVTPKAVPAIPAPVVKRPQPVVEDLGTMTIEGIEAHGYRYITTTPVGEIGNDQPLVTTQETWHATGLALDVRSVHDDPQQGKQTMELVKLDQSEPDPATFQPPEGYDIVTEEMVPCKEP